MTSSLCEMDGQKIKSINPRSLTETLKMNLKGLLIQVKGKGTLKKMNGKYTSHNLFRSGATQNQKYFFCIDDF